MTGAWPETVVLIPPTVSSKPLSRKKALLPGPPAVNDNTDVSAIWLAVPSCSTSDPDASPIVIFPAMAFTPAVFCRTSVPPVMSVAPEYVFAAVPPSVSVPAPVLVTLPPGPPITLEIVPVVVPPLLVTVRVFAPKLTSPVFTFSEPTPEWLIPTGPLLTVIPPLMEKLVPVRLMPPAALASSKPVNVDVPPPAICVIDPAATDAAFTLFALVMVTAPRRVAPPAPLNRTLPPVPAFSVRPSAAGRRACHACR